MSLPSLTPTLPDPALSLEPKPPPDKHPPPPKPSSPNSPTLSWASLFRSSATGATGATRLLNRIAEATPDGVRLDPIHIEQCREQWQLAAIGCFLGRAPPVDYLKKELGHKWGTRGPRLAHNPAPLCSGRIY